MVRKWRGSSLCVELYVGCGGYRSLETNDFLDYYGGAKCCFGIIAAALGRA